MHDVVVDFIFFFFVSFWNIVNKVVFVAQYIVHYFSMHTTGQWIFQALSENLFIFTINV